MSRLSRDTDADVPFSPSADTPRGGQSTRSHVVAGLAILTIGVCLWVLISLLGVTFNSGSSTPPLGATPLPRHPYAIAPAAVSSTGPAQHSSATAVHRPPPGHVIIPSLGVTAPLIPEAISNSQLGIPADVHHVGIWSGGGQVIGTVGTVLLAGHVNWWNQGNGALYNLASIQPGALVEITAPTGTVTTWSIDALHAYRKANLPQTIFAPAGSRRLVLVTCGGAFNASTGHYADNVVAEAVPVAPPTPPPATPAAAGGGA